jgi:type I restriction enzyme S subunit
MVAIVGGTIGNLGVLGIDMCFPDSMVGVRPHPLACQDYILLLLRYYQPQVRKLAYQMAGQPNIKLPTLNNLVLALPPLAEQKAIVTKVESLLALCDQLEQQVTAAQTHAEQLMQAVLKEAFQQNGRSVGECAAD